MSAALTLAGPDQLEKILPLVASYHLEAGIDSTDASRMTGIAPLLDGIPQGCAYLIGPPRAPIGYIVITFGWSVEFGGLDAIIDELYVRPGVRGRGIGSEALIALPRALASGGLRAIHLEVDRSNEQALKLYQRAGFTPRNNSVSLSKRL
ncbi:GNAT family N-acetyltransferase [Sulfitobacter guttiformis]|uniref:Acetyltransferase (GNAT) family protein n=1 Tax=Sulfitobacter guttiformis TaxID=74349 RepID=A0A420DMV6_9RHOB|nr:GNAT family N-acetyltransferase [Sulfitobacter guttiformis]KIN72826.1 Acetyltransferase, GNAT family [Sulfitobacter guttiformis KCTC 32187]RKE95517.1 acetyltransferase (GNAT) family protein [Sulfitobacter guttiformis]